jgi:hypothetical protein
MRLPAKLDGATPEVRRRAVAELLAKGIFRMRSDLPPLQVPHSSEIALQSPTKQGSMSKVVNAPNPGESRHGAECREGSRPDGTNVRQ